MTSAQNKQGSQSSNKSYCSSLDSVELLEYVREAPPLLCRFKVESFSKLCDLLKKKEIDHFESTEFEAGGYKWKLSIYPSGKKTENGDGHVSLYLKMADQVPGDKVIHATIRFFIYDHLRDLYLTIQESIAGARGKRFDVTSTQWGIPRLMDVTTFKDPDNGFLIDDCCVFGAELLFPDEKNSCITSLSPVRGGLLDACNTFVWNVDNFSTLKEDSHFSPVFSLGAYEWKLKLCPRGDREPKGKSLSLYLTTAFTTCGERKKLFVRYELRLMNQVYDTHHKIMAASHWFSKEGTGWGCSNFVSLADLNNLSNGYRRNDTIIVEVKIHEILVLKDM